MITTAEHIIAHKIQDAQDRAKRAESRLVITHGPDAHGLCTGKAALDFMAMAPGDPSRYFVPEYLWRIVNCTDRALEYGIIRFRYGLGEGIEQYAGHIGIEIRPEYRGQGIALDAIRAVKPFIHAHGIDPIVIVTAPNNHAMQKVIARAGGQIVRAYAPDLHDEDGHGWNVYHIAKERE